MTSINIGISSEMPQLEVPCSEIGVLGTQKYREMRGRESAIEKRIDETTDRNFKEGNYEPPINRQQSWLDDSTPFPQSVRVRTVKDSMIIRLAYLLGTTLLTLGAYLCLINTSFSQLPVLAKHYVQVRPKSASICVTPGCVLAASEILHNISPNYGQIDPCTDFRTYVCQGWDLAHDLREDQSDMFTGTIMHETSQLLLRHILESPFPKAPRTGGDVSIVDEENFYKLQNAYSACLDESKIRAQDSGPLLDILHRIEEMYPARRPSHDFSLQRTSTARGQRSLGQFEDRALSEVLAYLNSIRVEAMVSLKIQADDRDPDATVLSLSPLRPPGLPSKEYYKDKNLTQTYAETIGHVLEALLREAGTGINSRILENSPRGAPAWDIRSGELVQSLVDFESKLAEAMPDLEEAEDVTKYYNPRTLEEIHALLPQVSIQHIISRQAPSFVPNKIIVGSPSYLTALSELLDRSSRETIQAYLVWKTVQAYGFYIEDDAIKPLRRFQNRLQGKDPDVKEERWRTCVKHVDYNLGWILSRFYTERAFSRVAKEFGDRIVYDIKDQFVRKLNTTRWMSEDVKQLGIEKVHNIIQKIGYPTKSPDIGDPEALRKYYAPVNVTDSTFFDNALSMAQGHVTRMWAKAGKPTDRDSWVMSVPTVNAYYNPAGNEIVFPAGIMQSPVFYDPTIPQYLSYGAFGSVAGHELSHAFDSTGRHYDQRGNYTGWWDQSTIGAFKEKAECFVGQYHNFSVPGLDGKPLHVNGRLTLGENIADAGGLSASFAAWKRREAEHPAELLPGLQHFAKEQLFFMSYGNWWCGKTRDETQANRIYSDPHSPTFARILGTMANSREFRESFNCPQKEPTCEIW